MRFTRGNIQKRKNLLRENMKLRFKISTERTRRNDKSQENLGATLRNKLKKHSMKKGGLFNCNWRLFHVNGIQNIIWNYLRVAQNFHKPLLNWDRTI